MPLKVLLFAMAALLVRTAQAQESVLSQSAGDSVRIASATSELKHASTNLEAAWPMQLNVGQFKIHSVTALSNFEPQLRAIDRLPRDITETLGVTLTNERIDIVVLKTREAMEAYAKRLIPNAPSHRALYIRHRGPGLVLTYLHPEWACDARHECTHALLDASGIKLPLWQEEGLAEYFETASGDAVQHANHLASVQAQMRFGQVVELDRLERHEPAAGLDAKTYRDAWSVVTLILHASPQTRKAYQDYLHDVQERKAAGFLSHRLSSVVDSWRTAYTDFYRPIVGSNR